MKFLPILLLALLFSIPGVCAEDTSGPSEPMVVQASESKQVWVNTASGVYHYPGTRWYGKTKQGEFMSEAEAKAKGYRPALNGQLQAGGGSTRAGSPGRMPSRIQFMPARDFALCCFFRKPLT